MEVSIAANLIASSLTEEAKYLHHVIDHVRQHQGELSMLCSFLQHVDANPPLGREDHRIRSLTQEVSQLAIRGEDAIDKYLADAKAINIRNKLCLRFVCFALPMSPVHRLIKEIEGIGRDIKQAATATATATRFAEYGAVESRANTFQRSRLRPIPPYLVVGIDADVANLAKMLTSPAGDFKVLGIVGIGGMGKTTLAMELYRHNQVARCFLYKAFVSVSREWTGIDLLQQIFRQVKGVEWIPSSEMELAEELYYFLKDKQCLIVVDDIWHIEAWDAIYPALPCNQGSRFILTTRNEEVPRYADARCFIHSPKPLTEDQQWMLFTKVAMEGRDHIENYDVFEMLGKRILANCGGLPLAVVTLAGFLRRKPGVYEWEKVHKAISDHKIPTEMDIERVWGTLELSYLDLPDYLKPCFLYMAIIPEDHDIPAKMLTQMWIAEGFITSDLQWGNEILEDVAMQMLEELAQRCLLEVTSRSVRGDIEKCHLHDLLRHLSISKAKEQCFFETITNISVRSPSQPRRILINSRGCVVLEENHHLKTLVLGLLNPDGVLENLDSIGKKFKLLRVLNIRGVEHVALPKQIGNLVLLRYLGINATRISELPKSIKNLINLLYIDILSPGDLRVGDPILLSNMENLRGVVLPRLTRGSFNSLGLTHSRKLQSLISGAGTWMKQDLPRVSRTVNNLEIYGIEEMEEIEAIYQCPGITEGGLCTLICDYKDSGLDFDLQKLMQCTTLWSLELRGLLKDRSEGGIHFPPTLEKLCLSGSRIEEWLDLMQLLGDLPNLKYLSLSYGAYLGKQLHCTTATAFPVLQELHLFKLYNLEEWGMKKGAMSGLRKLGIEHCLKLKKLPESIRYINFLKELEITSMPEEFCKRIGYGGEDSEIIQHIPSLKITTGLR